MALHRNGEPDVAASLTPLPAGALVIQVPGRYSASAVIDGTDRHVVADPVLAGDAQRAVAGVRVQDDMLVLDLRRVREGTDRIVVCALPKQPRQWQPPGSELTVSITGADGLLHARFSVVPTRPEGVQPLAEIFRSAGSWQARALPMRQPESHDDVPGRDDGLPGLVNALRFRLGLPPLRTDVRLARAAQEHAAALATRGAAGWRVPDETSLFDRVEAAGYRYLTLTEHLADGPGTAVELSRHCLSSERTVRAWGDPGVTDFGLGHSAGASGTVVWAALWARPFCADGLARLLAEVVSLTNIERAAAGLPALVADPRLAAAAQGHSADMAARRFYAHTSPEGGTPADRALAAGCRSDGIGENIACGQRTAAEVVRGWMDSPGHRANILRRAFTLIGVGYATGGRAGTYWTQMFGAPVTHRGAGGPVGNHV